MKTLVIAEKPSAGADMAKVLNCTQKKTGYIEGDRYIVTWAIGHLVGLKYPEEHDPRYKQWRLEDLPFYFSFQDSLKVLSNTKAQFQVVKQLINRADVGSIINAGDAGREGYLIQEWIYRLAGNRKPKKVLWASSLTDEALKKAFANLKEPTEFKLLLEEAEARAMGDYSMGINYSRALTLTIGKQKTMLSYGRCQTPLLHLIVRRDNEIESFVSRPYYNIELQYSKGFKGTLLLDGKIADIFDEEEVRHFEMKLQGDHRPAIVMEYISTDKQRKPPALYNLAELQKNMGSHYGYAPEETLAIAQTLYEKYKVLSYPRTDSRALSMDLYREVGEHIKSCKWGKYESIVDRIDLTKIQPDKAYFNDVKVTDHHALIPTIHSDMKQAFSQMTEPERNVFEAVVRSFLAIFYPPYEYQVTEIVTEKAGCNFSSKGTVIKSLGYKEVFNLEDKEDDDSKEILPVLEKGHELNVDGVKAIDKKTKPPARYTVSSIIALMEKNHIGTSATRGEIIKKLMNQRNPYIRLEKSKYYSTELGRDYINVLPEALKDVEITAKFENQLQEISAGNITKEAFLQQLRDEEVEIIGYLKSCQETVGISSTPQKIPESSNLRCPKCGKPVRENTKAFGCTGYRDGCEFTIWKEKAGKKVTESMVKQLISKGSTSVLKGFKKKDGSTFDAALILVDGKVEFKRG
ncbi:type IA DNA topoisomerase [Lacrimispora amygdalina]|uniref:type IA DNA topoisomerase n=1 Tax=Lacrimispora amygdalina TaxID=253257 RepID=UPI000BE261C7|nr:type IA DNA topoisomerase [Lacrimispora amygdalina]